MRLKDRVAIVVGAGQSPGEGMGNGRATALTFAREGAKVLCVDHNLASAQETVDLIRQSQGVAEAFKADVTKEGDIKNMIADAHGRWGRIDILHNNVGVSLSGGDAELDDITEEAFDRCTAINLKSCIFAAKHVLPIMRKQQSGAIINISSIGVLASPPRFSAYVASKAALDAFSLCAASEFADANVRFTTIHMPLVRTPMIAPTKLYDAFPALSPDEAAELVMSAVIDQPKRVATGLGRAGALAQAVAPGASEFVLNHAFRLFPESAAARGTDASVPDEALPKGPADLARKLFAQVFSGVYW